MATTTQSPDAIERDIKQTQESISDTVNELQHRFSPRALMDSLIGDGSDGSDKLIDAARRNPLAVGLIGAGALMLASGKSPSLPSFGGASSHNGPEDRAHRSYLAHMNAVEHREGEHAESYRRRRDTARADYFMLEQGHDEDEPSFRKRLDDAGHKLRERTSSFGDALSHHGQQLSDGASSAADRTGRKGKQAASKARRSYQQNPMISGLIAAAVGAVLGAVIPETQYEDDTLGDLGQSARSSVTSAVAKGKDQAVEQANKALETSSS